MDYQEAIEYLRANDIRKDEDGSYYEFGDVSFHVEIRLSNLSINLRTSINVDCANTMWAYYGFHMNYWYSYYVNEHCADFLSLLVVRQHAPFAVDGACRTLQPSVYTRDDSTVSVKSEREVFRAE